MPLRELRGEGSSLCAAPLHGNTVIVTGSRLAHAITSAKIEIFRGTKVAAK
jgi:hypothetical protein